MVKSQGASPDQIEERVRREVIFGAFVDGRLCATATFLRQASAKRRHVGMMWTMHESEKRRGTGLSDMVVLAYTAGDEYVTETSGRCFDYLCLIQGLRFH